MTRPVVIPLTSYCDRRMTSPLITPEAWRSPLADFTRWMRGADYPQTTEKLRLYHLRRFAITSRIAPYSVTTEDLLDYLGSHQWSSATRRSVRTSLRAFYKWAHAAGRIPHDPAALLPKISQQAGRPRPAPDAAIREALTHADDRERLMIRLAAEASLRACEIARVHTNDLTGARGRYELTVHGKGRKIRVIPVSDSLAAAIRDREPGWVFPGLIDGHLSAAYVSKLVSRALPDGWTAHTLRHRFASTAYKATKDLRAVQELLGHASVATTQIYTAVEDDAKRDAVMFAAVA